jgi:hypothetical protein
MPRMIDLIRNSELPSNLMQSAARGSLSVSPLEMIEILVHLAVHNKVFGEQAGLTLAGWDEKASLAAAADPKTSAEVLGYFFAQENLRTALLPTLAENASVDEESLGGLAASGSRWVVETLLRSKRVLGSPTLLQALQSNPSLRPAELAEIGNKLASFEVTSKFEPQPPEAEVDEAILEGAVSKYLEANAAELEVEKDQAFQSIGMDRDHDAEAEAEVVTQTGSASAGTDGSKTVAPKSAAAAAPAAHAKKPLVSEKRRDSALWRISKLDIKSRIALAMRGSKEERSILIRDSTKLVALAVLDSPKVSETEVEAFALQKNVLDSVLRAIPMKRRFAKNYTILRNVVQNPRTPLDASLPLVKGLLIHDLKNLADNKDVSETIRKTAMRLFRQRLEKRG